MVRRKRLPRRTRLPAGVDVGDPTEVRAGKKLAKFMESLSEDERKAVWNIFYRQTKM